MFSRGSENRAARGAAAKGHRRPGSADNVEWLWIGLGIVGGLAALAALGLHAYILVRYLRIVERIFQEMPPFRAPLGAPAADAEGVALTTADGVALRGCYLPA